LAEEIKKLGGRKVEVKNRAVNCEGDLVFYKINYSARTALKILVPIHNLKLSTSISFMTGLLNLNGMNLWMWISLFPLMQQ
jgi:putative N6-adenine-specific DNA methylase